MNKENNELKKAGLKATLPRIRILEALDSHGKERINSGHHLSAEDIYKHLLNSGEDVGLATVYRVLGQFEAAGIVKRHNFEEGLSVYEIAEEEHHDHMVCLDTGAVNEFSDELIEERQKLIAEKYGYELVDHTMVLYVKPISKK